VATIFTLNGGRLVEKGKSGRQDTDNTLIFATTTGGAITSCSVGQPPSNGALSCPPFVFQICPLQASCGGGRPAVVVASTLLSGCQRVQLTAFPTCR